MARCECCGTSFEPEEAKEYFESETALSYRNLRVCLCGECAVRELDDYADGMYYETCMKCGSTFDLIEHESHFRDFLDSFDSCGGWTLRDFWDSGALCAECAVKAALNSMDSETSDDEVDFDEESLNVWDAADIWASSGKDEDSMFGYTEEELEDAL